MLPAPRAPFLPASRPRLPPRQLGRSPLSFSLRVDFSADATQPRPPRNCGAGALGPPRTRTGRMLVPDKVPHSAGSEMYTVYIANQLSGDKEHNHQMGPYRNDPRIPCAAFA